MSKITVYINDVPANVEDCHSVIEVEGWREAKVLLWALAKQAQRNYATAWPFSGVESMDNWAMKYLPVPANIAVEVSQKVAVLNDQELMDIVECALSDVEADLVAYIGNNPSFSAQVGRFATKWAEDLANSVAESPRQDPIFYPAPELPNIDSGECRGPSYSDKQPGTSPKAEAKTQPRRTRRGKHAAPLVPKSVDSMQWTDDEVMTRGNEEEYQHNIIPTRGRSD